MLLACLLVASCASTSNKKSNAGFEEWVDHPETLLALSKAVLAGIRHLLDEMALSEMWFEDMDISITSAESEVLTAKITRFAISKNPSESMYSQWRIFKKSLEYLEYTNTVYYDNTRLDAGSAVDSDSLFIDVYETSSRFSPEAYRDLSGIEITYWRKMASGDAIVTLRLHRESEGDYAVYH